MADILDKASKDCYLFFAELFDGDLQTLLEDIKGETGEIQCKVLFSMILQIGMAQTYLDSINISHNDTNGGNILYLKLDDKEGYFEYTGKEKKVYIKHYGYLFVLWDFGLVSNSRDKQGNSLRIPPLYTWSWLSTTKLSLPAHFIDETYVNNQQIKLRCSFLFELFILLNYMLLYMENINITHYRSAYDFFNYFNMLFVQRFLIGNPDKDFNKQGISNWMFGEINCRDNDLNDLNDQNNFGSFKSIIHLMKYRGFDIYEDYINEVLPTSVPASITATYDSAQYL